MGSKNTEQEGLEEEFLTEPDEDFAEPSLSFNEPAQAALPRGKRPGRSRKGAQQEAGVSVVQEQGVSVEDLAKALSEQLKTPVEEFVESIEGIQNQIPIMVKKGIAGVLVAVQADIQTVVENRVNTLVYGYTEALKSQQRKINLKIYGVVISMAVVSLAALVGLAWYMTPSWSEIQQKRTLAQSLQKELRSIPYEVKYLGQTYVRITPDSEIVLHGHDGNHTYAIPENPSAKPK